MILTKKMILTTLIMGLFVIGPVWADKSNIIDLKTVQSIALKDNPGLKVVLDRISKAQARLILARSGYYPKISARAGVSRIWSPDSKISLYPDDPENVYSLALSGSWTLFDGFERRYSSLAAKSGTKEKKYSHQDAVRLLLMGVTNAYFNAQLARSNIKIVKADEAFNLRQLKDAHIRQQVGTGTRSHVLNFEIQANVARAALILANQNYDNSLISLAELMGIPEACLPAGTEPTTLEDETPDEMTIPEEGPLKTYALEHRPDLLKTAEMVRQIKFSIAQIQAQYYPRLDLTSQLDSTRFNDPGFEQNDFGFNIGLALTYQFYDGGVRKASLAEARASKNEAQHSLELLRNQVVSEVRQAFSDLKAARDQVALQRTTTSLVQKNRDLVEKEYQAGQVSLTRLNEAQRDLIKADSQLALALVSLRRAWYYLQIVTAKSIVKPGNF